MFKDNLTTLRKQAGISQEDLANAIGVSRQSISKYENGGAEPDLTRLASIKQYFDCSYDALLGEKGAALAAKSSHGGNGLITIQSAIDQRVEQLSGFMIANRLGGRKNAPRAVLVGISAKAGMFGEGTGIELGLYASRSDAERELNAIQNAIAHGQVTYQLQFNTKVKKSSWFSSKIRRTSGRNELYDSER